MLRGKFETGRNGTYAWLNDVVGVGVLKRNGTSAVRIDMWHVSTNALTKCRKLKLIRTIGDAWGIKTSTNWYDNP
jgi:hypothetical protein